MTTPSRFDQRRAWLDELLARRDLSPAQEETVRELAAELGVPVVFYRIDLWNYAGWQEFERVQN